MRAPVSLRCSRPGSRRALGMGMERRPERYFPVMEFGVGGDLGDGAGGEELAAEFAGAGTEVEEVVGGTDDVGVVLDDEDGVAEVAEVFHDADELGGVAGVEADGGLVEDVEGADEAGAERGGELNALRFAAGEGGGEAVEGEVVEADLLEKVGALADFFKDLAGDFHLGGGKGEAIEEGGRAGDGEGGDFADVFGGVGAGADVDGAGLGAETGAAAVGAGGVAAVLGKEDADVELVFFAGRAQRRSRECRRSLPAPSSMICCWAGVRSYQGTSVGMPAALAARFISA